MRTNRLSIGCLACAASIVAVAYDQVAESPADRMTAAADRFLTTLDGRQKSKVLLAYDAPERLKWNFVPLESRKGLSFKEMTDEQRDLARSVLGTALSEAGREKANSIINLENLLQTLEGDERRWPRDWLLYYVTIYGDPKIDGRWGLSFEGHHLSLNFVVEEKRVIASTPQFMGANPATVRTGGERTPAGTRVLGDEEQLGFDLLASFDVGQRTKAVIADKAPREIRAAGEPQPPTEVAGGLAAAEMTETQRRTLRKLIEVYAGAMPRQVAEERLDAIDAAGFDQVRFAWLGADKPGVGHAYRVQGPTFLIEFVNTQPDAEGNPANHVHSVWRDMRGDFAIPIR